MISRSGMRLLARCLLGPRHCAIAIVVVDVSPSTTLVRRMALILGGVAGSSFASESARP
jgi:Mg-chelatase subunit ChlD